MALLNDAMDNPTLISEMNNIKVETADTLSSMETMVDDVMETSIDNCNLFGTIGSLVAEATEEFSNGIKSLTSSIQSAVTAVTEQASLVIKNVKEQFAKFSTFIDSIVTKANVLFGQSRSKIIELVNKFKTGLDSVKSGIMSAVSDIKNAISDIMDNMVKGIKKFGAKKCSSVTSVASNLPSGVSSFVDSVSSGVKDTVSGLAENAMGTVKTALTSTVSSLTGSVTTAMNSVTSAVTDVESSIASLKAFA